MSAPTRLARPSNRAWTHFADRMLGRLRVQVQEHQRAIVLANGRFADILGPGEHVFWTTERDIVVEVHDLNRAEFASAYEVALFRARPDLAARHLTEFVAGTGEIVAVLRDGRLHRLLGPEQRVALWTAAGSWDVERHDLATSLDVPPDLARRLERTGATSPYVTRVVVAAEQAGLLFVDGAYERRLAPGAHLFWTVGRRIEVKSIDLRRQSIDVSGQEVLTRDRVSIRINLAADYRVTDPVSAATTVKDFSDTLYRSIQYAFRKTLGARTLDEILEQKIGVDAQAADALRRELAAIGIEVGEIALKDVILPGDMREILNKVVTAEKEAQANVIRRREETAATRSLLNTAKVMEENPIMLRLKELEALEKIADKVESLVIHNGPKGLLRDIAKLSDDD